MLFGKNIVIILRRSLILVLSAVLLVLASSALFLHYHNIRVPTVAFLKEPRIAMLSSPDKTFGPTEQAYLFLALLRSARYFEFTTDFFGLKYKGRSNELIDQSVLSLGGFEKPTLALMKDLMQTLAPGGTFVDVGANVGQHSLFMSKYAGTVHAFDPYEPVLERFREMVAINDIANIHIHAVGLGAQDAIIPFFEPPVNNPGAGSFLEDWADEAGKSIDLRIVEGDPYFDRIGIKGVDLIKIDIEGYEKQAIQGLSRTLSRDKPVVVMELNLGTGERFRNMADVISSFPKGYSFFTYESYRLDDRYELSAVGASSKPRSRALVAIPEDKLPLIGLHNAG